MEPFRACTIREELTVTETVERATKEHPLAENIFDSAIWRIAREPDCGTPMAGIDESRRVLKLLPNRLGKTPGLLLRYRRVSQDLVSIEWVRYYPYDDTIAVVPAAYVR